MHLIRYCFCALHAHMRLTEALVKPLLDAADGTGRVGRLQNSFLEHAGLSNIFTLEDKKVTGTVEKKYKPISFKAWQCWKLLKTLPPDNAKALPQELAIVRIIRDMWPDAECSKDEDKLFRMALSALWEDFDKVVRIIRCRVPTAARLKGYEVVLREFGARWALLMPAHKCAAFYLHTVTFHAPDFMTFLLERDLCIGMLENSGAERRHQYGRRAYAATGRGGLRKRDWDNVPYRVPFLILRAILIWQYGSDLVAHEEALRRDRSADSDVTGAKVASGRRLSSGTSPATAAAASESMPESSPAPTQLTSDDTDEEHDVAQTRMAYEAMSALAQRQGGSDQDGACEEDDGIVEECEGDDAEDEDAAKHNAEYDTDSEYGSREPSDDEEVEGDQGKSVGSSEDEDNAQEDDVERPCV